MVTFRRSYAEETNGARGDPRDLFGTALLVPSAAN